MHIESYLSDVASGGTVSEIAFYTPLVTHILRGLFGYPSSNCLINKTGVSGIPDIRVLSTADRSEWLVCEAKLNDTDILTDARRQRIWNEQVIGKNYITAETVYVLLCSPLTFRIYDTKGHLIAGCDLLKEQSLLRDVKTGEEFPLKDAEIKRIMYCISSAAAKEMPQYKAFRRGELTGGYIQLDQETVKHLRPVFEYGLKELKDYCKTSFVGLKTDYERVQALRAEVSAQKEFAGTETELRERVLNRERSIKRRYRVATQLFEEDYLQFKHDQAYAGTEKEEHFEEIFITNTAYIALTRLFFVRICEDIGLTSRKVSNEGPGVWARFVEHIKHEYKDLLTIAYKDASHVYSRLFEETIFDWFGSGNGRLNDIFERILLRLNAFSFEKVDRDLLGTVYQYFRPRAERKRLGEYYTPVEVVDYILARTGILTDAAIMSKRILDPACGSFTFGVRASLPLLHAGEHLTARNKIALVQKCLTGRDINPFSVFLSHLSLLFTMLDTYRLAKIEESNFVIAGFDVSNVNSLAVETGQVELTSPLQLIEGRSVDGRFDYVVGNPPFVRNERLPQEDRNTLQVTFAELRSGNTDIATYFLHCALCWWLKDEGVLGMVAPIGQANAKNAQALRNELSNYTIYEIVSLEWMAKEIFPDADIIPMLLFIKKADPPQDHKISVVTGLTNKTELREALGEGPFRSSHVSEVPYAQWLNISPTGDWPLDVTSHDMPILERLSEGPRLQTAADAQYGIKLGSAGAKIASLRELGIEESVGFGKGHHICAFGISEPEESIDLSKIVKVDDPSIWGDLSFYQANEGRRNETGLDGITYVSNSLLVETLPSDTLCCVVPQVYTTLVAAVIDPLKLAINNSSMVIVPRKCSAHVLAAIINSRICRYYAFLTMRAAILLRRRSTWYPRALKNLPWPSLNAQAATELHNLAKEASQISNFAQQTELDVYLQGVSEVNNRTSTGFLGIYLEGPQTTVDADDLSTATIQGNIMRVGASSIHAPDDDTIQLVRLAALASETLTFDNHGLQGLLLPSDPQVRRQVATHVRELADRLEVAKSRMDSIAEESDAIIASGLGLTKDEHEVIKGRCLEVPLSVTVNRPRYTWNPDRKIQARRMYEAGERFK